MRFILCFFLLLTGCTTLPEVYFCPQDNCAERIRQELLKTEESVLFATYSFTHAELGTQLIILHQHNITIEGIIEKQTASSNQSQFHPLVLQGIPVVTDKNSGLMHNKVFVIDKKVVITGSFNPTKNGDERNNENVVIIRNEKIAQQYHNEIKRIIEVSG